MCHNTHASQDTNLSRGIYPPLHVGNSTLLLAQVSEVGNGGVEGHVDSPGFILASYWCPRLSYKNVVSHIAHLYSKNRIVFEYGGLRNMIMSFQIGSWCTYSACC